MNDNLEQQLQNLADKVQPDASWFSGAKGDLLSKIANLPPGSVEFAVSSAA